MSDTLHYNEIQQRSIHNAYDKQEQLLDQIIRHRVRNLELDLHAWGDGQGGHQAICPSHPEWFIYHHIGQPGRNIFTLGDALRLLKAFHDANPKHEVITLHLELKARGISADSTFHCYTPDDLDRKIASGLGSSNLFTPADLLAANPGTTTLFHSVGNTDIPGATPAGRWPTIEALRGKFIIVVHGHNRTSPGVDFPDEIDDYANAANANERVGFIMREDLWHNSDEVILANKHVVFHGEAFGDRAVHIRHRFPGLILRGSQVDDAQSFPVRQKEGCQIILTDRVDVHLFPFVRTHNDRLFPFGRAGFAGPSAWTHPAVADRSEGGTLYLLATDSGDLWGTEDRFSFAYSPERAPAFDTWTAAVATTSNNSVEDWGKVALMARASLSPNAPYFAVGRAADSHGLVIQYRSTGCGNPPNSSPCGTAQERLGNRDNIGDENIQFIRLEVKKRSDGSSLCQGYGSIDGFNWHQIGSDVILAIDLPYRGMAASSHGSRNPDGTPEWFFFQNLRRNGRAPAGHRFVAVSVSNRTPQVITHLTDYSAKSGGAWNIAQITPNGAFGGWHIMGDARGIGEIALGQNADGRLEVFATDTAAGLVWHNWQVSPNGGWHGWQRLFDAVGAGRLAVGRNADGRLEVFALDAKEGSAWHAWQGAPNGAFGGWHIMGDNRDFARIAVARNADSRLHVVAVD